MTLAQIVTLQQKAALVISLDDNPKAWIALKKNVSFSSNNRDKCKLSFSWFSEVANISMWTIGNSTVDPVLFINVIPIIKECDDKCLTIEGKNGVLEIHDDDCTKIKEFVCLQSGTGKWLPM